MIRRQVNIGRDGAIALISQTIVLEYVTMRKLGVGIEIEHFTSWWMREYVSSYSEDFENQVMEQVIRNLGNIKW